jgi:hypothetical protein
MLPTGILAVLVMIGIVASCDYNIKYNVVEISMKHYPAHLATRRMKVEHDIIYSKIRVNSAHQPRDVERARVEGGRELRRILASRLLFTFLDQNMLALLGQ